MKKESKIGIEELDQVSGGNCKDAIKYAERLVGPTARDWYNQGGIKFLREKLRQQFGDFVARDFDEKLDD